MTWTLPVEKRYPPGQFEPTVHAAVIWMYGQLAKAKVENPTIAVLARSNQVVAEISSLLGKEHSYKTQKLKPVPHEVVWDAELSAAAAVVLAAMLEWLPFQGRLGSRWKPFWRREAI